METYWKIINKSRIQADEKNTIIQIYNYVKSCKEFENDYFILEIDRDKCLEKFGDDIYIPE